VSSGNAEMKLVESGSRLISQCYSQWEIKRINDMSGPLDVTNTHSHTYEQASPSNKHDDS